jgi:DnaJ-class molecular chaperone
VPRSCRFCHGSGSIWHNPADGTGRRPDPQEDVNAPCERCDGSGDEPSDDVIANNQAIAEEWERWAAMTTILWVR